MTDQKPNCGNCPHAPTKEINKRYDTFDTYKYFCRLHNLWIFGTAFNTIEIVGCLSHPGARAWLMKDVIEELERQETNYTNKMLDQISRGNIQLEDEFGGISKGFSRAAILIKNGVEKK